MKKAVALILAVVTVLSLSGCGIIEKFLPDVTLNWIETTETEQPATSDSEPVEVPTTASTEFTVETEAPVTAATEASPESAPVTTETTEPTEPAVTEGSSEAEKSYPYLNSPVVWPGGTIEIVGAEIVEEGINTAVFRYYYDFTNTTSDTARTQEVVIADVYQSGQLCTYAWTELEDGFADKYQISDLLVRPGCTVRCMEQFEIDPGVGEVEVTFTTAFSPDSATFYFDPADLPGAPEDFDLDPIENPTWTEDLLDGGVYNGDYYVCIDRGEVVEGVDGERVFRVYFDFTNNSAQETSFWISSFFHAYQDGLELRSGYPLEYVAEDDQYYESIAPGETISVSACFELRSDSNVEIELENYMVWGEANLGCEFILG